MERDVWHSLYRRMVLGLSLPEEAREHRGRVLLHFSDTPSTFYSAMRHLIDYFEPVCIVHTGDLADEVKLELHPGELALYRKKLEALRSVLSPLSEDRVVIITGNHDHEGSVREYFPEGRVIEGGTRLNLFGLDLNLSHEPERLGTPLARFNLFGHSMPREVGTTGDRIFLNGLKAIHVLNVDSGVVLSIPYPKYVDDARFNRKKVGL